MALLARQARYEEAVNSVCMRKGIHERFSLVRKCRSEFGRKIRFGMILGKLNVFLEEVTYLF